MAEHSSGKPITIERVQPREAGRLTLVSEAIGEDGRIGDAYSGYHDDLSPPLVWTGMPDAESFALIVEDPDAATDKPVRHWVVWNIPGALQGLPGSIRPEAVSPSHGGMVQGLNTHGQPGYMGPKPPPDDGPHRYHFQLFALDMRLTLKPDAPFEHLVEELKGHTIASCDLVGLYEEDADPVAPVQVKHEPRAFRGGDEARGGLDEDDADKHARHDSQGVVSSGSAGT
jgi:Raf kinase inhibitor-like YbhB/YbcL family protein